MRFADKRVIAVLILAGALASCSRPGTKDLILVRFSCDSLEGLISRVGVTIDGRVKKEGQGALKIVVSEPAVVRLFETGNVNIEDAALVYQAKVRTEDIQGRVYLEMWCHFQGKGEFFSRGLDTSLSGTTKWTLLETSFFLKSGENPDNVKLNIVCEGSGTAWVDDIRMVKRGS